MKTIKAGCYYLYKSMSNIEEFIIYVKSVKKIEGNGFDLDRKLWSPSDSIEGPVKYIAGLFAMRDLIRISEKAALLQIAAWML